MGPGEGDYGGWIFPGATVQFGLPGPVPCNLNNPQDLPIYYDGYPLGGLLPTYWAPRPFDPSNPTGPTAPTSKIRTYLSYDFDVKDVNSYTNAQVDNSYLMTGALQNNNGGWGNHGNDCRPQRGPSAAHPQVVNHLFADGSARSLAKETDAAAYMFLITRAGHDPNPDNITNK